MSFPAEPDPRPPGVPYPAVRYQGTAGQTITWVRPHDAPREAMSEQERLEFYLFHDNHWL